MGVQIEQPRSYGNLDNHELNTKRLFLPDRQLGVRGSVTLATGAGFAHFWRQAHTRQFNRVGLQTRGTAAGATPTLVKQAVYSVALDWANETYTATLMESTANVAGSILTGTFTSYETALGGTVTLEAGKVYCTFTLVVTGATAPIVYGYDQGLAGTSVMGMFPPVGVKITSLTDVPASFTQATSNLTNQNTEIPFFWFRSV